MQPINTVSACDTRRVIHSGHRVNQGRKGMIVTFLNLALDFFSVPSPIKGVLR